MPPEDPLDELPDELEPPDREPPEEEPELELPDDPPELPGLVIPARPLPLELEPDDRVDVDWPPLLPELGLVVAPPDDGRELVPDPEGRVMPDGVLLGADLGALPVVLSPESPRPVVNEPRLLHESGDESPDRVAGVARVDESGSERSDPDGVMRAPPMVVMTRCAGSVDPAFPLRQSSLACVESLRAGARLTGWPPSRLAGLLRVCARGSGSGSFAGACLVSVGCAGSGLVTGRDLGSEPPWLLRVSGVGAGLSVRGLTTPEPPDDVPPSERVPVDGVDRVPVEGVDRVPGAGVEPVPVDGVGLVTVPPVPPRVTVPPVVPPPVVPRVTTPGSLLPVVSLGAVAPVVPRVAVDVVCVPRGSPRVTRSRTAAEGLGSLWKNCVTSAGDPAPWLVPVPLPSPPRMIRSATRDGSLMSSLLTRTVWFESTPLLPSRASRVLTSSAVSEARSTRVENRPFRSTTVYACRSFDEIVTRPWKPYPRWYPQLLQ